MPLHAASARTRHHHHRRHPTIAARHATHHVKAHRRDAQPAAGSTRSPAPLAALAPAHARPSQHQRQRLAGHAWRSRTKTSDELVARRTAHAAGDPTDTISDFQFAPATLTVHVGDTITWINNGPAPHTATARGGSFDTGLLKKGASGSHTFTQAGTFAYFCTVHPFMHGTVVVLANAASSTPSTHPTPTTPSGSTGTPTTPAAGTAASTPAQATGPSLPNTGIDDWSTATVGLVLLALGVTLRRERRERG